jgi:hypothetical protein
MTKDKQLVVSHKDDNIHPYFTGDPNVKYLIYTNQMDMVKPTEYYIVYDFETMEEPLNDKNKDTFIAREHHHTSSSSLSQPSSSSSSPTQDTTKISHVVLLSTAWDAKTKSRIKTGYFDRRDGDDIIIK